MAIIITCLGCGKTWDNDMDPCACTCKDGDENYEDWSVEVVPAACRVCGGNEEPPYHNAKCAARGYHDYEDVPLTSGMPVEGAN